MSTFGVTIERIAKIWPHPNADRLEMAQLASMTFQFVIPKAQYQVGDLVAYFPVDSLLPPPVIEKLGLVGKLSGREKNRVKTVRLREQISQGVVAMPQSLLENISELHEGQDITALVGVTKYEPPVIPSQAGNLVRLPQMVSVYDIEGAERIADLIVAYLMDQPVLITEKLEGSHFAASLLGDGSVAISQRQYRIEPVAEKEHDWHKAARISGIADALPGIKTTLEELLNHPIDVLTVRGEVLGPGVQKNIYKLPNHQVYAFDIEVNGAAVNADLYLAMVAQFNLPHAPVLAVGVTLRDWLDGETLAEASNGPSVLNAETLREGVVIHPMIEMRDGKIGRVIVKQRSPEYLSTSDF
jgi:RNA ligase (TIGR02306 family)